MWELHKYGTHDVLYIKQVIYVMYHLGRPTIMLVVFPNHGW